LTPKPTQPNRRGRPPAGSVVERNTKNGTTYALRFTANGSRQYVTLGSSRDGWSMARAEEELANVLADVRRGVWQPRRRVDPQAVTVPTFHVFASAWFAAREGELRPKTQAAYRWQLASHLLPFFHGHRLDEITVAEVDRYRERKVREGELSPDSINTTITRLGQILDVAVERELIARNPVKVNTRNRKVKTTRPRPVYLDTVEQIVALLDAASELDGRPTARTRGRRALLATLACAGLRASEACALRWRDVDLSENRLFVGDSKTDAGKRVVYLLPVLAGELLAQKLAADPVRPDGLVFPTARGAARDVNNLNRRVFRPVVERADELLVERGHNPLPAGLTPHKLRHTYATLAFVLNPDPAFVMQQLGHTHPAFSLGVYAHVWNRDEGAKDRLRAFAEGGIEALSQPHFGTNGPSSRGVYTEPNPLAKANPSAAIEENGERPELDSNQRPTP
jgi:integrase